MNNYINILDIPLVSQIVNDAEVKIREQTGAEVRLSVRVIAPHNIAERKSLLQEIIVQTFNEPWVKIKGKSRKDPLQNARHMYSYFAKHFLRQSLKSTGHDLGGRDHTTIINSLKQMQNYFDTKDEILSLFEIIKKELPPLQ